MHETHHARRSAAHPPSVVDPRAGAGPVPTVPSTGMVSAMSVQGIHQPSAVGHLLEAIGLHADGLGMGALHPDGEGAARTIERRDTLDLHGASSLGLLKTGVTQPIRLPGPACAASHQEETSKTSDIVSIVFHSGLGRD
jgi:hypothetical protein